MVRLLLLSLLIFLPPSSPSHVKMLITNTTGSHPSPSIGAKDVLATPQIRHLAKSLGIDLSRVAPGSGRDGRVERGDLDAYLARIQSQVCVWFLALWVDVSYM